MYVWYVSTYVHAFLENIPFSTKTPLILLISAFFAGILRNFPKNGIFTQSNSMKAVLEIF